MRPAVESVLEADDRGTLRICASDFDGVFNRFGAGIQDDRFLCKVARRERVEFFRQSDVALIGRHREAEMQMLVQLFLNRGHHARGTMSHVQAADASREIEIAVAVDVFDRRAFRARGENGRGVVRCARHRGFAASHQGSRAGAGNFRANLNRSHVQYHPIGVSSRFTKTCLVSRYSSRPQGPSSRPNPDCLYPPQGAST